MQERQVTIEGETRPLAPPFVVLATQNPIEYEGTYPLPEAQLDRFLLRVGVGYPAREDEWRVLERRMERGADEIELEPIVDRAQLVELQAALEQVHVSEPVGLYMVDLVAATRGSTRVQVGVEPARHARAAQALARQGGARGARLRDARRREGGRGARARAPADAAAGAWVQRVRGEDVVEEALRAVPTPRAEDVPRVTTRWTPKLATYAALGAVGLAAALVLGRPEAVGLAAPFLLVLAVGLPLSRAPHLRAWVERDRERVLEGEEIDVAVEVETDAPVERLELLLVLPRGLEPSSRSRTRGRCGWPATARSASRWRSGARTGAPIASATSCCAPTTGSGWPSTTRGSTGASPCASTRGRRRCSTCCGRSRRRSTPATRSRGRAARGSSSPTCGSSCRATGSSGSTGARRRGDRSCG